MKPPRHLTSGVDAEQLASSFLQQRGLQLIAQNFRTRYGEIDLIMNDGSELVFVEVRLRRNAFFGGGVDSVTQTKRSRIVAAAKQYLQSYARVPACRFDVIALDALDTKNIDWIRNAFDDT